jgi:hypothetical protein
VVDVALVVLVRDIDGGADVVVEVSAVTEVLAEVAGAEVVDGVVVDAAGLLDCVLDGVPVARTCTLSPLEHAASADVTAAATARTAAPLRRMPGRLIGPLPSRETPSTVTHGHRSSRIAVRRTPAVEGLLRRTTAARFRPR